MNGEIKVKLPGRGYGIQIAPGLLKRAGGAIRKVSRAKQVLILSVPRVYGRYGAAIRGSLAAHFKRISVLEIPDGEIHKNEKTLLSVLRKMKRLGFHRDSCVVALGGGVVGDLGGLAASLYMRGTDFVQVPTTLLAQVDASVGGKTAIDFQGIKNLIGSFYQPKLVLIDPNALKSLDARQMRTGLAEIIKYGVIRDRMLFGQLEKNMDLFFRGDGRFLAFLIRRSIGLKAAIISADEKEQGKRMWLNYGHTLGHALESYYGYQVLTHGEAIAYGMWAAALISRSLGVCSPRTVQRQYGLLKAAGLLRPAPRFDVARVYQKLFLDKKVRSGQIQFILTRKIGLVTIQKNIEKNLIFSTLNRLQVEMTHPSI